MTSLTTNFPKVLMNFYKERGNTYTINTRGASKGEIYLPSFDSTKYGRKSIKIQSILSWNYLITLYPKSKFRNMSRNNVKKLIKKHFLDMYVA